MQRATMTEIQQAGISWQIAYAGTTYIRTADGRWWTDEGSAGVPEAWGRRCEQPQEPSLVAIAWGHVAARVDAATRMRAGIERDGSVVAE